MDKGLRYLISRSDAIGDVVLTLPMAGLLKELDPTCHITFIGRDYTKPILERCEHIDEVLVWDHSLKRLEGDVIFHVFPRKEIAALAKRSRISTRVGSARRLYHWWTCNKRPWFTRANSDLHEAQLNLKLLEGIGVQRELSLKELPKYYGLPVDEPALYRSCFENRFYASAKALVSGRSSYEALAPRKTDFRITIGISEKRKVILHPKSAGSAVEWGLEQYAKLIELLSPEKYEVFITGTEEEGKMIRNKLPLHLPHVHDTTGKFSLPQLIDFIAKADILVAASTGPLHIAAAMGKKVIGLYSPRRPIHPGRWAPIGLRAEALVFDPDCPICREGREACLCLQRIDPKEVLKKIN